MTFSCHESCWRVVNQCEVQPLQNEKELMKYLKRFKATAEQVVYKQDLGRKCEYIISRQTDDVDHFMKIYSVI